MQAIIFTLCSNNYLAHAKSLGDSIGRWCPESHFIIGLVDRRHPAINYDFFQPAEVIDYDQIGFPFFSEMLSIYNIVEFNTAVKPYYFEFLMNRYGKEAKILYLDPDIVVYEKLGHLFDLLDNNNIVLTPNLTRAHDSVTRGELASLKCGIYNLGFVGLRNNDESLRFIRWWEVRLREHCKKDKLQGLFVDQKWIDLAPLFFSGIFLEYHVGYNMAWWNLNERKLITEGGKFFVNDTDHPLYFFHFSGYVLGSPNYSGRVNDSEEYSFNAQPELREIFKEYDASLTNNNYQRYSKLKPLLGFASSKPRFRTMVRRTLESKTKAFLRKWLSL